MDNFVGAVCRNTFYDGRRINASGCGDNISEVEHVDKTGFKRRRGGWSIFWKSVVFTLAAVALVALGFFGAMIVTGIFA